MGEAARRRKQQPMPDAVTDALRDIEQVGQGIWQLNIWTSEAVIAALRTVPDDDAVLDIGLLRQTIERIEHSRGPGGPLCLLCEAEFSRVALPRAIAILRPGIDALRAAPGAGHWVITNGVCADCAAQPEPRERVLAYYRRTLIPNAREIRLAEAGAA
jgi:hypothetical protein